MKEKLTFKQVRSDAENKCKRDMIRVSCLTPIVLAIDLLGALMVSLTSGNSAVGAMWVIVAAVCILFELYVVLRFLRAKNGKLSVKKDVLYRREIVCRRFLSRKREALYFRNYGRFFYGMVNRELFRDIECGEAVYLVFTGIFPNIIVYAYSAEKYEADFEVE